MPANPEEGLTALKGEALSAFDGSVGESESARRAQRALGGGTRWTKLRGQL